MKKRSGLSLLLAACIGFTAVPCAADMQEQLESKKVMRKKICRN